MFTDCGVNISALQWIFLGKPTTQQTPDREGQSVEIMAVLGAVNRLVFQEKEKQVRLREKTVEESVAYVDSGRLDCNF